ncbi:MAG: PQQ-binding-like beta-propeller repeat protein [Thermoguttaceae bacterium]
MDWRRKWMMLAACAWFVCLVGTGAHGEETAASARGDWPRFHGPRGDNLCRETGLLSAWPEGGPKLLWTARGIGEGYGSIAIAKGRIYVSGSLRDQTVITALDLEGNICWKASGGDAWTGAYPGTRGTPTVDGDRVYHESPLGQVVCLEAQSGRQCWTLNLLEEFDAKNLTWGLAESLLVDGQRLICCPGGEHTSMVALDKTSGQVIWTADSVGSRAGYATPVLVTHQGLRIVLTMTENALIGVNAESGQLLFRHPHETRYGANVTSPLFCDGWIFITSGYRSGSEMLRLAVDGTKASVERVWESADLDNLHGGVILLDGCIYGAAHQAAGRRQTPWICLDWKTGKTKHVARGVGVGTLTGADGMLYTLGEDGEVSLVRPGPDGYHTVSTFRLPRHDQGPAWAHPVVCGGRLYIRRGEVLYAYAIEGRELRAR